MSEPVIREVRDAGEILYTDTSASHRGRGRAVGRLIFWVRDIEWTVLVPLGMRVCTCVCVCVCVCVNKPA